MPIPFSNGSLDRARSPGSEDILSLLMGSCRPSGGALAFLRVPWFDLAKFSAALIVGLFCSTESVHELVMSPSGRSKTKSGVCFGVCLTLTAGRDILLSCFCCISKDFSPAITSSKAVSMSTLKSSGVVSADITLRTSFSSGLPLRSRTLLETVSISTDSELMGVWEVDTQEHDTSAHLFKDDDGDIGGDEFPISLSFSTTYSKTGLCSNEDKDVLTVLELSVRDLDVSFFSPQSTTPPPPPPPLLSKTDPHGTGGGDSSACTSRMWLSLMETFGCENDLSQASSPESSLI